MKIFDLDGCRVRPWTDGDQEALARHANNRAVWRNLKDRFPHPWFPHPYTRDDADAWIEACQNAPPDTRFAIEVDGEAAGGIELTRMSGVFRKTAAIGYWLGEAPWGRGLMTQVVRAVTPWGFKRHDLVRIEAGVFDWNPASARVLEKTGYRYEGRLRRCIVKDGECIDRLMYARLAQDE